VKDARTVKVALPESQKKDDGRAQGVGAIRIRLRDMRLLDYNTNPNSSFSIVVRRHSVLISLDPIRVVVMADRGVVMEPPGDLGHIMTCLGGFMATWSTVDGGGGVSGGVGGGATTKHPQMEVTRSSATRGGSGGQASSAGAVDESDVHLFDADKEDDHDDGPGASATWFEYHAYEAIFTTLNTLHAQSYKALQKEVDFVLQYFTQMRAVIIPLDIQERFQMLKTDLDTFINRMKSYRRALSMLTANKEAMALMNLSLLKEAPWYYNAPLRREILACHDEVEQLLDSYLLEARTVLVRAENLVVKVRHW
jgi:hypothetical protein